MHRLKREKCVEMASCRRVLGLQECQQEAGAHRDNEEGRKELAAWVPTASMQTLLTLIREEGAAGESPRWVCHLFLQHAHSTQCTFSITISGERTSLDLISGSVYQKQLGTSAKQARLSRVPFDSSKFLWASKASYVQ